MSGVGKSSLLAAVQPGLELRTAAVSERSGESRHTTAQVRLVWLEGGGAVVDSKCSYGLSKVAVMTFECVPAVRCTR